MNNIVSERHVLTLNQVLAYLCSDLSLSSMVPLTFAGPIWIYSILGIGTVINVLLFVYRRRHHQIVSQTQQNNVAVSRVHSPINDPKYWANKKVGQRSWV